MAESLHAQIAAARQALVMAGFSPVDAALDADILAQHVLGWDLARLLAHNREPAPRGFGEKFSGLIARRRAREPVALITGHREFWGLDFVVTPATLIPRPETELVVEEALRWLPSDMPSIVLDIGTGTGCLAVSIAHERSAARVVATDINQAALVVARHNARVHGIADRMHLVRTDLAAGLRMSADVIVSNPPYVPDQDASGMVADVVQYEPASALFGGPDGLSVIRRLFTGGRDHLAPRGVFIVEFGYGQEDQVREAAETAGWSVVRVLHDLQQIARTVVLRR